MKRHAGIIVFLSSLTLAVLLYGCGEDEGTPVDTGDNNPPVSPAAVAGQWQSEPYVWDPGSGCCDTLAVEVTFQQSKGVLTGTADVYWRDEGTFDDQPVSGTVTVDSCFFTVAMGAPGDADNLEYSLEVDGDTLIGVFGWWPPPPNIPVKFKKKPPTPVLSNDYVGELFLNFTNSFPSFDETTSVPVTVNKQGQMAFGTGTLSYSGDDNDGQTRIRRVGTLTIQPNGSWFDNNGEDYFSVYENTSLEETFTVWYWDGSSWQQAINETVTDTWNGGLAFSLDDAVISGSVVEVVTSQGSVRWTLTLTPVP